jgi:hypothetical protein
MKKLYIPTTTLNFNNILSSESISPKSFYEKRDFGYSRWFSIPENNFDNVILLYETLCSFIRPKSDYEDHPLLIEVSFPEENTSNLNQLEKGIYYCDHTIYLTPWNTRFLFFSDEDKRITLSMSDSSLETKLLKLYSKRLLVEHPKSDYKLITSPNNFEINISEIEKDIRINKMKGLLYGYYIGALLSSSSKSVIRLNVLREILNIFAAILSSLERRPTDYQSNRLDSLLRELRNTDPFYKKLYNIIEDSEKANQVLSLIKYEYGSLNNEIDKDRLLDDLYSNKEQMGTRNTSITWIEKEIAHQETLISDEHQPLSPNKSEIVLIDNRLSIISADIINDEIKNSLFKTWINDLFFSKEYNGKVNSFKEKLSDDITTKAKEIYQEKWENSYARDFLNKLRRHVRGDEFGQQWDNGIFSSIAAVITNGGEWSKLLLFMQGKEMYDYRLAFAMFGALNGFANLTRDFTDNIYSCDSRYIMEIYKEFHGQLFGHNPIVEYVGVKNEESFKEDNDKVLSVKTIEETDILSFIDTLIAKCKGAEKDKHIYEKFFKEYGMSYELLQAIKDEKRLNKGKGAQKTITSWVEKEINPKNKIQKKQPSQETTFFIEEKPQIGSEFYKDTNVLAYLANLLPNEKKIRSQFKEDLDWFQDEYKKNNLSQYYGKASRDNVSVIEAYNRYLAKKKYANKLDISQIISKLKELYS